MFEHPSILGPPSPLPHGGRDPVRLVARAWADEDALRSRLRALAGALPALDLRLARILAWLRTRDLAPLGYAGWQAFTREHVDWAESWIRSLVRLVRSGLTLVLRAACEGRIPLSVAVRAPATCRPDEQEAWLAAPVTARRRRPSGASFTVEPDEADALVIWHARHRVRLLEGLPLTDRESDDRMLAWWRAGRSPEEIIAAALAPAPPPAPAPGDAHVAAPGGDLADALLGPWRAPADLTDAMVLLGEVQAARRGRAVELGRLYAQVLREGLVEAWGFGSVEAFCQATMGLSARTLQRHRELARALRRLPALEAATDAGLSLARAEAVGRVANEEDAERWVGVAKRTPTVELVRATQHVAAGADADALLDAYEATMAATTGSVGLAAVQKPVPRPLTTRVHPDLPKAARWLMSVALPRQRGFGRVKERDRYVCANPECRRRALRNHAHHVRFRSEGGGDTLDNGICLCPSCHLRLVHPGHVRVEQVGDTQVWSYPGRQVTVVPGPRM